jgi:hypothetical protein
MKTKGARAAEYARMSDSYKSGQGRVAYERSRAKPEDTAYAHFASTMVGAFLGMIVQFFKRLFTRVRPEMAYERRHKNIGTPPRGFGKAHRLGPISGPPVLAPKHNDGSTRRANRRARKYALRGYGYIKPEPKRGTVEVVGKTDRVNWLKPKVKA